MPGKFLENGQQKEIPEKSPNRFIAYHVGKCLKTHFQVLVTNKTHARNLGKTRGPLGLVAIDSRNRYLNLYLNQVRLHRSIPHCIDGSTVLVQTFDGKIACAAAC